MVSLMAICSCLPAESKGWECREMFETYPNSSSAFANQGDGRGSSPSSTVMRPRSMNVLSDGNNGGR